MKMKNVESLYPLSPLQKGILFHAVSDPQSSIYLVQFHCTLTGPLDLPAFQQAWQQELDRHSTLRTAFLWEGLDEWLQVVRQHAPLPWEVHDWTAKDSAEQKRAFDDFLKEDGRKLFNLSRAPLMRVTVLRLKDDLHRLVWTQHHLILDGWSVAIVLKEVLACYEGIVRRMDQQLPRVRPYRDFIAWLRQLDLSRAEFFWRTYLKGFTAPTQLPFHHLEDREGWRKTAQPGRLTRQLSAELSRSLKSFSRGQQLTLNTVFQGAWALLLSRYSGQDDVVFGAVVSGRPAALSGTEAMVGLFVNTLPLRAIINPDGPLVPWLQDLQARFLEARQFEHSLLVDVQGWSEVPRGISLFESILAFENYPVDHALKTSPGGFQISDVGVTDPTNYPLTLEVVPGNQMTMAISYRADRYEGDTIERLLAQLEALLTEMAEQPKARLRDLSFLTPQERQLVLHEWNRTERDYPANSCAYQLVETQAEQTPEAVAVSCEGNNLTYRELNRQADRLAIRLRSLGVTPDTPVGLCVERSVEMVIGLLGIWKAGGTYVPLDPTYPDQRLVFMLQDAKPAAVVTQRALAEKLSLYEGSKVLLEELRELPAPVLSDRGASSVTPDDGAYILYTSGSTGSPKGVVMPHRCLTNLIAWQEAQFVSRPARRTLQFASMSFDVSVQEILSALCAGGTLFIATDEVRISPAKLLAFVREHQVERVFLPPVVFQHLAETAMTEATPLPALKEVICAGEQLVVTPAIRHFLRLGEGCLLENHYGPTESHVVTSFAVEGEPPLGPVPIGRPIANTKIYLLDMGLHPVPVGAIGEIYIGGHGLARGYLNRPDLTTERFLPNPFVVRERLYRTGDLARFRADGAIEFIGRSDHQVKLRGYRIELGEVETTLAGFDGVQQAVAMVRHDTGRPQQLVAYVIPKTGISVASQSLLEHLRASLPSYMVPSAVVILDHLPLLPNGKVDRRCLPEPDYDAGQKGGSKARSPVEATLLEIWERVLGTSRLGIHDNFFERGGHSLLATQVMSRVRELFQLDLPLRVLFEGPTVAELAACIDRHREHGLSRSTVPPIERIPRNGPLPLSFSQQRMWFMHQLAPDSAAYNMAGATRLQGALHRGALFQAVEYLARRHEAFRTRFVSINGEPAQHVSERAHVKIEEIDLRLCAAAQRIGEAHRILAQESRRPFDLANGPLARFVLLQLAEDDFILLVNVHHIISDQWSTGLITSEFSALYNELSNDRVPQLADLAIQYADFATWQRKWLVGETLARQLEFWRERLANLPVLSLPTDRPRPSRQSFRGSYVTIEFSEALIQQVKQVSWQLGVTLYMTMLACFNVLLSRYSGQEDIAIGSPIANRNQLAVEKLVGTLVNTLVMRTNLSGDPTFVQLLERVRNVCLGAYANQDMPFEKLVDELQVTRDMSHSPLFQVLFNVVNAPMNAIELEGLQITPVNFDRGGAQFDLSLSVDSEFTKKIYLEFATDLFDQATAERMLEQYRILLESVTADPQRQISTYQFLGQSEHRMLIHDWNRTREDYPRSAVLPSLITAQAGQTPDAVAVAMERETITYRELEARSNQFARYLRRQGVQRGDLVGICLERSPTMVVGLLAILKTGATYVPLDPDYPRERVRFMVEDAGGRFVVTSSMLADRIPPEGRHVICVDRETDRIAREVTTAPEGPQPSDVAYVIYTSGSTGKPKGVEIQHQALVNFLCSMQKAPGITERDILLSVTTLSFDIAGLELYLPLMVGARIVLVSRSVAMDGRQLMQRLEHCGATMMQATPATWRMLIDAGWKGSRSLTVLCGGEPLPRELADQLLTRVDGLWNMYGPTETTIWSTVSKIESADNITIGRPIANTELYVLDKTHQPVPIGVPGELHIGGDGLARGYRNRPELTSERFIPHPFTDRPGARIYKTGDLVRYGSDGRVIHLGRLDHQVKIRGFRIELGEIEAILNRHPAVKQVVVAAREDRAGVKALVAYLIPAVGQQMAVSELRTFLRANLPDYMVPSYFVILQAFPLTANGKVDVKALPPPSKEVTAPQGQRVLPHTPLEIQLTALWQQVLGQTDISVHDNFFDLGGHSLTAVQLFAQLEQVFGKQLPLATLFQAPTVAQLAKVLTAAEWTPPWRSLVAIQPSGDATPLFAVPGVGGNVLVFAKLAKLLGADQPFYGLQTKGLDGKEEPFISITDMATHYIEEIRSVQPHGPYFIGGTCTGGVVAYEIAQQLMSRGEQVILAIMESWHPSSYRSHQHKPPILLWPLLFVCAKVSEYVGALGRLPMKKWSTFFQGKLKKLSAVLSGNVQETLRDSTFDVERVKQATFLAVSRYEARAYRGSLLNVIASKRPIAESTLDTRAIWGTLAQNDSQTIYIPAEDSGRLFVSPHVEELTRHLIQYMTEESAKRAEQSYSRRRGNSNTENNSSVA